jgi:hypothetical protein
MHGRLEAGVMRGRLKAGVMHGRLKAGVMHGSLEAAPMRGSLEAALMHGNLEAALLGSCHETFLRQTRLSGLLLRRSRRTGMTRAMLSSGTNLINVRQWGGKRG